MEKSNGNLADCLKNPASCHMSAVSQNSLTDRGLQMSDMMRIVRQKIEGIDSGEYRIDGFPGSTTVTYTVGFALDRFEEIGSERTAQEAFNWLDREQIEIVQAIRAERCLPSIQYRQNHDRHSFGVC